MVGEDQATARSDLENAGFKVQVVEQETTDPSQDGIVIDQDPAGGTQAPQRRDGDDRRWALVGLDVGPTDL